MARGVPEGSGPGFGESAGDLEPLLEELRVELAGLDRGTVASYIPELAQADPNLFGIAVCGLDGEVVGVGDSEHPFTLQSVSKPFLYGRALELFGADAVHARVGVEPTGDAFDAIVQIDETRRRPHNAMINAGAIAITGLFAQSRDDGTGGSVPGLLANLGAFAGLAALPVDVPVYLSECATAHRNRAIAHLLRYFKVLEQPVEDTLDLYFHQCAARVTARELAVMAATLAGGGRNPLTGARVLSPEVCGTVLAVLATCGLYDASGRFLFDVGLPGKSGVSGGLLAVAPGRFGFAAYSPALDADGNSVRGVEALRRLSRRLELHAFQPRPHVVQAASGARVRPAPAKRITRESLEHAMQGASSFEGARVADYAPALAAADPTRIALAACEIDGSEVAVGDVQQLFTLQAAASPFGFAYVARAVGSQAVLARCGVEPSGNPFHAILLDPRSNRPYNPLGNAGAIAVAGLAPGQDGTGRLKGLLEFFGELSGGRAPSVDAAMLAAEKKAGERNRAIASLLCWADVLKDRDAALDLYLQQCCIEVGVVQLARFAATLANGGVQPQSGKVVLSPEIVRETLSLMYTCGHHDQSGSVAVTVGLPAKSGISGAIVVVAPGRAGIAAWSPAVNDQGTSVRGLSCIAALSAKHDLRIF